MIGISDLNVAKDNRTLKYYTLFVLYFIILENSTK